MFKVERFIGLPKPNTPTTGTILATTHGCHVPVDYLLPTTNDSLPKGMVVASIVDNAEIRRPLTNREAAEMSLHLSRI